MIGDIMGKQAKIAGYLILLNACGPFFYAFIGLDGE